MAWQFLDGFFGRNVISITKDPQGPDHRHRGAHQPAEPIIHVGVRRRATHDPESGTEGAGAVRSEAARKLSRTDPPGRRPPEAAQALTQKDEEEGMGLQGVLTDGGGGRDG